MANCFLTGEHKDYETAILLSKAIQTDLTKVTIADDDNPVAFTDKKTTFINSEEKLAKLLPDYNQGMLKWLLWHEEYHRKLNHHSRYSHYCEELSKKDTTFNLTKKEVNIIMDILVHDRLSEMFPELIETAKTNLAQFRNRNSLKYTFKTYTLEKMLNEYSKYKQEQAPSKKEGSNIKGNETSENNKDKDNKKEADVDDKKVDDKKEEPINENDDKNNKEKESINKNNNESISKNNSDEQEPADWEELEKISGEEFIDEEYAKHIINKVNKLKIKKIQLGRLTKTLNTLVTTKRERTYRLPSVLSMNDGCIFKGKTPGKIDLYLVFDASGSMQDVLDLFKEIISKSIPQAMKVPCEWFAGCEEKILSYEYNYYKGTFKDILPVQALGGYNNDGDRTIELCLKAEEQGYSPIGVTDGGWDLVRPDNAKKLKRTILIGNREKWLNRVKSVNPRIQTLCIYTTKEDIEDI